MRWVSPILGLILIVLVLPLAAASNTPSSLVPVQGKLLNASGAALNGSYDMLFSLYSQDTGGTALYSENRSGNNAINVSGGFFDVLVGNVTSLSSINFTQDLWLEINVSNESLSPRLRLASSPYAITSQRVHDIQTLNESSVFVNKTGTGAGDVLYVENAGTGYGIYIDQQGGGNGLYVLQSGGNKHAVNVEQTQNKSGLKILKTGKGGTQALQVHNEGTGPAIYVNNTGASSSLVIEQVGNGKGILVNQFHNNSGIEIFKNTSGTGLGINVTNAGGDAAIGIIQDGYGPALTINNNGFDALGANYALKITSGANSAPGVYFSQMANQTALEIYKQGTGTGIGINLTTAGTDTGMYIQQNGVGNALVIDQNGASTAIDVTQIHNASGIAIHKLSSGLGAGISVDNEGLQPGIYINGSLNSGHGIVAQMFNTGIAAAFESYNTVSTADVLVLTNNNTGGAALNLTGLNGGGATIHSSTGPGNWIENTTDYFYSNGTVDASHGFGTGNLVLNITNYAVSTNSIIFAIPSGSPGVPVNLVVSAITPGISFNLTTVNSSNIANDFSVAYFIVN